MRKATVSVVIPNYNYAHFLREAIDSALAQTYKDIEVIVVDDGSTDASADVIASYDSRIHPVFSQNQGVAAARNRGVAESTGEYIAFLDADDAWLPTKIEKQVERFAADTALGLVHVGVEDIDGEGNPLLNRTVGLEG